jgi:antitoxin (DNA-binding transcriptional repressor) of toxin-antitoxin stability system
MLRLNIEQAKMHLSKYLARAEKTGDTILLCRRNQPIAEIHLLPKKRKTPRPFGLAKGKILPGFFDPLPDDILDAFEGKD